MADNKVSNQSLNELDTPVQEHVAGLCREFGGVAGQCSSALVIGGYISRNETRWQETVRQICEEGAKVGASEQQMALNAGLAAGTKLNCKPPKRGEAGMSVKM